VLGRYVDYIAARIAGLGGDPNAIPPSPNGAPAQATPEIVCYTGKAVEIIYDCFGRLEGFVLRDCDGLHKFKTCEREIGEIAIRACQHGMLLSVCVDGNKEQRIRKLILKC
jgi:hypothetical protein